ncbi:MAG TPA: DUF2335 domain-containing protein [Gammaproteobacteria bacterium]|nr:DUF2335 domain-containing protein [Gammaproteobacteria bacterium]
MNNNHIMHAIQKTTTIRIAPIPTAEELAKYESIYPGSADRILILAEKQSKHRRLLETKNLNTQADHLRRRDMEAVLGQVFAFIITLIALIMGVFAVTKGYSFFGAGVSFSAIGAIVWCFIKGRRTS